MSTSHLARSRRCATALLTVAVAASVSAALSGTAQAAPAPTAAPTAAGGASYLVLAPQGRGSDKAVQRVQQAGGSVVARYDEIGVLVARSATADFASAVLGDGVESAAPTGSLGTRLDGGLEDTAVAAEDPATTAEPLWSRQWDMQAIDVAQAHEVTTGSKDVVVGVLDSGIESAHPDLAGQVDPAQSVSCIGGKQDTSVAAWQPTASDHGTHVAGTIAAARNGIGIVGVAPGVTLAAVKVVDDKGFIYPEAAVCGFMWAADHGFDVTNNSYYIDPWEFNCRNDARQRPVWQAVQRAIRYSANHGVLNVASAGNSNVDLQHKTVDSGSPDDGTPETRNINSACLDLPAEAPGVVTVSSTGPTGAKAYYSSYGQGVVELAAPGGDYWHRGTAADGRVLSTVPGGYGYKQGTSMAGPHVAGVAALAKSVHPGMNPGQLASFLQRTADPVPCPPGVFVPPNKPTFTATCTGGAVNGFFGAGEVNAYSAVTR